MNVTISEERFQLAESSLPLTIEPVEEATVRVTTGRRMVALRSLASRLFTAIIKNVTPQAQNRLRATWIHQSVYVKSVHSGLKYRTMLINEPNPMTSAPRNTLSRWSLSSPQNETRS
ncbi:hypothetical protein KL938_001128 [Ogataea parapolymorpha]|nr:hypothetical protein KL938_001128 [Ogataea parapolymorpha]